MRATRDRRESRYGAWLRYPRCTLTHMDQPQQQQKQLRNGLYGKNHVEVTRTARMFSRVLLKKKKKWLESFEDFEIEK